MFEIAFDVKEREFLNHNECCREIYFLVADQMLIPLR
jgi:hypothetical protein